MEDSFRARVRAGDADAFGKLFDEYARAIHRYAYRLTGDAGEAEDVVAQTFLRGLAHATKGATRGRQPSSLGCTASPRTCCATPVGRRGAIAPRSTASRARSPRPTTPTTWRSATARKRSPPQHAPPCGPFARESREVVALCVWSGLTYAQAAEALGVPVGTIRSRLSRAKSRLLQEIGRSELEAMRAATMELNDACGQGGSVCTSIAGPEKERG